MNVCDFLGEGLPPTSVERARQVSEVRGRFVRLSSLVFFLGEKEDHIMIPPAYCSCTDFKINSIMRRRRPYCYHLLAYCLNERSGKVALVRNEYLSNVYGGEILTILVRRIVKEIYTIGRSPTLRRFMLNHIMQST